MRAWLNLRYTVPERRAVFISGLKRLGYDVRDGLTVNPEPGDILVTWNRIGQGDKAARAFEKRGLTVLVTENAAWGNGFCGERWYTLARGWHNRSHCFPVGDTGRWGRLPVKLHPWRTSGETVILPQRGIGTKPVAMPLEWPKDALRRYGGRIRAHPGRMEQIPLTTDLARCGRVITWGSGAAIKALMLGIPVISEMPEWIGEQDNTDEGRLAMFQRLAWAQFRLEEFESGEAFARFL